MSQFRLRGVRARLLVAAFACAACLAALAPGSSLAAGDANTSACPNELLTGFTAALPDCRALEQVTPTYTETSKVRTFAISEDGARVLVASLGAFAGDGAGPELRGSLGVLYDISGGSGGWTTTPVSPENPAFRGAATWQVPSADLSKVLFDMPAAPAGQEEFFTREGNGPLSDVGPITPPADGAVVDPGPEGGGPKLGNFAFLGASSDLSHVVFGVESEYGWNNDPTAVAGGTNDLYEYVGVNNAEPVKVAVRGGAGSEELIGRCGAELGGPPETSSFNAISENGSVVFFTPLTRAPLNHSPEEGCGGEPGPSLMSLYARRNQAETTAISLPECSGGCAAVPTSDSAFAGASRDGRRVFFLSTQKLTAQGAEDSTPHDSAYRQEKNPIEEIEGKTGCQEAVGSGCNLYEYDFSKPAGERLVAVSAGSAVPHVQGVVRISGDGSHVYFVAQGKLTAEPNATHEEAVAGANNLYVYENSAGGGAGRTRFITDLAPSEEVEEHKTSPDESVWGGPAGSDAGRPGETTPDGRFLVFQSHADLTADDTSKGVWQVFEYEAEGGPGHEGLLQRLSIGENGYNSNGNTDEYNATIARNPEYRAVDKGTGSAPAPQFSAVSGDGRFVFFQSVDLLAAGGGVSASSGLQKVYEWHAGHVYRVAGGGSASASLLGTNLSGSDVFFSTTEQLVPGAPAAQAALYDARVEGGVAPAGVVACSGEGCLGAVPAAPSLGGQGDGVAIPGENLPAPAAGGSVKPTALSNAQKLAKALGACRRIRPKKGRSTCEKRARRTYGRSNG